MRLPWPKPLLHWENEICNRFDPAIGVFGEVRYEIFFVDGAYYAYFS